MRRRRGHDQCAHTGASVRHYSRNRHLTRPWRSSVAGYCVRLIIPRQCGGGHEQCVAPGRSTPLSMAGPATVRSTQCGAEEHGVCAGDSVPKTLVLLLKRGTKNCGRESAALPLLLLVHPMRCLHFTRHIAVNIGTKMPAQPCFVVREIPETGPFSHGLARFRLAR